MPKFAKIVVALDSQKQPDAVEELKALTRDTKEAYFIAVKGGNTVYRVNSGSVTGLARNYSDAALRRLPAIAIIPEGGELLQNKVVGIDGEGFPTNEDPYAGENRIHFLANGNYQVYAGRKTRTGDDARNFLLDNGISVWLPHEAELLKPEDIIKKYGIEAVH